MADQEILTDDYVAGLLARDAKQSSIKYSAVGLEAFTSSSKPPANKPKPNTRFLRNIIKDTDNHNAALLAKEAGEARARLESLATNDHREAKASRVGGGDIRRRQLGDIAAILGGRPNKRRKTDELKKPERDLRRRNASSEEDEPRRRSEKEERPRRKDQDEDVNAERSRSHKSQRRRHRSMSEDRHTDDRKRRHRSRSRSPRKHRESRHRHRSPRRERSLSRNDPDTGRERSHRSHHSSSKRKRSVSREDSALRKDKSRHSRRRSTSIERYVPKKRIESSMNKEPRPQPEHKPDYDSDPLDDIIGPRPPPVQQVRTRGRGTISQASGIDSRFASNYDPTLDVQLDPDEENDWDQALEALKDRQKWKQQGADRLRAAGFTEDEIVKWEKGGEKREEDVKWSKKGEGREWDKGKVLDDDGIVSLKPEWGRLKGT